MLPTETINAVVHLIEKFGFPIFVALCGIFFFWQMFSYMRATITKKDCEFLSFIASSAKQLADYVARRDEQVNSIVDSHNKSFQENTHALARLSDSIELRINREIRKDITDQQRGDKDVTVA